MIPSRARRFGRFSGALGLLAVLFALVPIALVVAARHRFGSASPVAGIPAPWAWDGRTIVESLRDPLSDQVVVDGVIRVCLLVAWGAISAIAIATALEIIHAVRHHGISMPAVRGLGWAQHVARSIAAGLLVLTPLVAPRTSLVGALDAGRLTAPTGAPADAGWPARAPVDPGDETTGDVARAPAVHVVARGESVYSIAEALAAGSPMDTDEVADAILDLNLGREMPGGQCFTNPAYVEVGWELLIPAALVPVERPTAPAPVVEHGTEGSDTAEQISTHVVERGDSLSTIAATHFGASDRWPAIWELNAGAEMGDGRVFDDPDLILPGWELRIPDEMRHDDAEDPTGAPAASNGAADVAAGDGSTTIDSAPSPSVADRPARVDPARDDTGSAPQVAAPETTSFPAAAEPPAPPPPTTAAAPPTTPAGSVPIVAAADRPGPAPAAPSPLRFEHAALVAAGIVTLAEVRRRSRLRRAVAPARVPTPSAHVVAAERRLRAIDPGERSARVDVGVRAAAHALIGGDAEIWVVLMSTDGTIELGLTRPADLPVPWTPVDSTGGRRWTLAAQVPIEDLAERARQVDAPCPALVQIADAGGRDVLVDLEACGTLAVEADPAEASEVITGIAAGLAASPGAEVAHLVGVSLAAEALLGHRNGHHTDTVASAFELAAALVGSTIRSTRTSFELRSLRTGGDAWEPAVIFLLPGDDDPEIDSLLPSGGHGLAVVLHAPPSSFERAPCRLVRDGDGWWLCAFGSEFTVQPLGLPPDDLRDVVDVVEAAGAHLSTSDGRAGTGARDLGGEGCAEHQIVVRLMGDVDIVSRTGATGSFERSKTVELIAWLATHREKSTRTAARTALWELDVRDATFANVVSEARRGLGRLVPPPEGEEWLARTLTEQLPLHAAVVTDADLIEQRLARSRTERPEEAVETLHPAAAMIRDMPFAGTNYLWPDAEGITSNLVLLATAVATELAQHALTLGDVELVFWATGRGLVVLPGHEELIGLRMRAHAQAGDLAGVRSEWESYERVIVADPWSDGEPAPKLLEIRRELLA